MTWKMRMWPQIESISCFPAYFKSFPGISMIFDSDLNFSVSREECSFLWSSEDSLKTSFPECMVMSRENPNLGTPIATTKWRICGKTTSLTAESVFRPKTLFPPFDKRFISSWFRWEREREREGGITVTHTHTLVSCHRNFLFVLLKERRTVQETIKRWGGSRVLSSQGMMDHLIFFRKRTISVCVSFPRKKRGESPGILTCEFNWCFSRFRNTKKHHIQFLTIYCFHQYLYIFLTSCSTRVWCQTASFYPRKMKDEKVSCWVNGREKRLEQESCSTYSHLQSSFRISFTFSSTFFPFLSLPELTNDLLPGRQSESSVLLLFMDIFIFSCLANRLSMSQCRW